MTSYSLRHLSDDSLSTGLDKSADDDRLANATLLAHIAEFDRRGLCLPTQYPSIYRYCVGHLRMSEDMAYRRVCVAKVARRFPFVFDAIADGRLNLSGVTLLWKHLTRANGRELLEAAMNLSKVEIREMLARRFPVTASASAPASATPGAEGSLLAGPPAEPLAGAMDENGQEPQQFSYAPARVENAGVFGAPAPNSLPELQLRVTPIAPGRYELVAVIDQASHDRLMGSKDLLGHAVPSGALVEVLQRAIALQHEHLRKRRCGATGRPRTSANGATDRPSPSTNPRQIPAEVQRAVWERDGGQCTYVSADGHRCGERGKLELDHIVPVAKGGDSTVENLRLLCSAHNRHAAEREFGKEHMQARREEAKRHRAAARFHKQAERERIAKRKSEIERQREELGVAFRNLGWHGDKLERALGCCATRPEATIEERIRYALSFMAPQVRKESFSVASAP
jgi:5-methylcytosine-specific restriction endonuclease McrA